MEQNNSIEEIEKLKGKAEKSREAHFMVAKKMNFRSNFLHSTILIGSSIIAILTFSNYDAFTPIFPSLKEDVFKFAVGILASLIFILTVIEEYVGWRDIARGHENAGKQLTSFIRDSDGLIINSVPSTLEVDNCRARYNMINEASPTIPNKYFLRAKQEHLIKVAISKELDTDPYMFIWLHKLQNSIQRFKK